MSLDKRNDTSGYQRIHFRLLRDEDGYPPQDWETLWAKEVEPELFQIDNIPFFVRNVSDGDVVSIEDRDGELHFTQVVRPSAHSVIRVILYNVVDVAWLRGELGKMGCSSELSHISSLISVDVPPSVSIDQIRDFLDKGEQKNRWGYEEASIRQ